MANIDFNQYSYGRGTPAYALWKTNMAEMLRKYLRGETIYVGFDQNREPKREGSIGRLVITNVQDLLHGEYEYRRTRYGQKTATTIEEIPANVQEGHFDHVQIIGHILWDGRKNKIQFNNWSEIWIDDHDPKTGTVWALEKPAEVPQVEAYDKLGREIKVGDFISYILYHFDNGGSAAGIYYGKVTKIEKDGTVHAKNIKLADDNVVAEKRIKDNSLIVIMTKDLMDKLMLARLSIL